MYGNYLLTGPKLLISTPDATKLLVVRIGAAGIEPDRHVSKAPLAGAFSCAVGQGAGKVRRHNESFSNMSALLRAELNERFPGLLNVVETWIQIGAGRNSA